MSKGVPVANESNESKYTHTHTGKSTPKLALFSCFRLQTVKRLGFTLLRFTTERSGDVTQLRPHQGVCTHIQFRQRVR